MYDIPCVGGPLNGHLIPAPLAYSDIVFEDGKYIYHPDHYRQPECWVWHKFIR